MPVVFLLQISRKIVDAIGFCLICQETIFHFYIYFFYFKIGARSVSRVENIIMIILKIRNIYICIYICRVFRVKGYKRKHDSNKHILNTFRQYPIKNMQPPSPLLRSGHTYMKDAQCAETSEKSVFRFLGFLFFEIWSIL